MHDSIPTPITRRSEPAVRGRRITGVSLEALREDGLTHPQIARDVVEEANRTAQEMLEQARAACDAIKEQAREEGYRDGYQQGYSDGDRDAAALIEVAEGIATNVAEERKVLLADSEGEIVELALEIANRIVEASVDVDPERVIDVCRGAMRKAFRREQLTVLAHPEDLEMLRTRGEALARELGGVEHLEFVEERRVPRGGVIVRTPAGEIDATLSGKQEVIARSLRELVEERRAAGATGHTAKAGGNDGLSN